MSEPASPRSPISRSSSAPKRHRSACAWVPTGLVALPALLVLMLVAVVAAALCLVLGPVIALVHCCQVRRGKQQFQYGFSRPEPIAGGDA